MRTIIDLLCVSNIKIIFFITKLIPLSSINFAWRRLVAERLGGVDLPGRVVPVALDVREAGTVDRGRSVVTEIKEHYLMLISDSEYVDR